MGMLKAENMKSSTFLSIIKDSDYEREIRNQSFKKAGIPAIILDREGKIIYISRDTKTIDGMITDTEAGYPDFFEEFIPVDDSVSFRKSYWDFMNDAHYIEKIIPGKITSTKSSSKKFIFILRKLLDNKLRVLGCLITIRKISQEEQIHNKILEEKEKAEKENRIKSEFLANITHELRTPLNAIIGFTEQMAKTGLTKKQAEFLNIIDKSSEHLLSLVNDLLVLSKIESGQLRIENIPFNLRSVIDEVYQTLKIKADEKKISFRVKIDDQLNRVLIGDPFRVKQILINIVANAIKFTETGSVEIVGGSEKTGDGLIMAGIEVTDTGMGIPEDKIDMIFDQFRQVDSSSTRRFGGTGLGLTISKKLTEHLGGTIHVKSTVGKGSHFKLTIPFTPGGENDKVEETNIKEFPDALKNLDVLIVDDDSINRLLGEIILRDFGCRVEMAANGEEALEKVSKTDFNLILLDIHMPGISGLEVARVIRKRFKNENVKIIAVTAAVLSEDIENYAKAGFNDYLIKPYKEINLFNKISNVFNMNEKPVIMSKTELILREEHQEKLYNLYNLKKVTKDDNRLLVKMLEILVQNSHTCIEDFNRYLKAKDWKNVGETAHKMLPSYRHLEVDAVVSGLVEIKNKTLESKEYDNVPFLVKDVTTSMNRIITLLNAEIRNYKR